MWLDGFYMGIFFYMCYIMIFEDGVKLDDIIYQYWFIEEYLCDEVIGLYFYGWDESGQMFWVDDEMGCLFGFWVCFMGWYVMVIVDVLDYLFELYFGYQELIIYLNGLVIVLVKV